MSWIDPPLPGRNGLSRSSPQIQLPPLVSRGGTPPFVGSVSHGGSFKDFLSSNSRRSKENDRGITAAAWSRKLPCGVPSKAMRMVRTHLSPVEDAMLARHTTKLEKAVEDATNGNRYLQTVSVVRRSRSVPAMQRHALETALASHIVRAKVALGEWHTGIIEINDLRRSRNPDKLQAALERWNFAEDDPLVQNAREDLARWKYIEEQMPEVLRQAMADKDMATIRDCMKKLSMSGPSNVQGAKEARALLRRYDSQARVLKEAITMRNVEVIQMALDSWEFPEDDIIDEAHATLEHRDEQSRELKMVCAYERINGNQLIAAVSGWEFESDNADFQDAVEKLQQFRMESAALEEILQQEPVNLMQLRIAMDSWSFATDPDSCDALHHAVAVLTSYENEVRTSLDVMDGHALRELQVDENGHALGNEELVAKATDLHSRHSKASSSLLELVRSAPNLEASAAAAISEKCNSWSFADNDPVLGLGRAWLRRHELAAECSESHLRAASAAGFEVPVLAALARQQALPGGNEAIAAAEGVVATTARAWQAAAAIAFGIEPSRLSALGLPPGTVRERETVEAMMQELNAAQSAVGHTSTPHFNQLKALETAPEGVSCLFQVFQCLLEGSSSWKPGKEDDTSWKALQQMFVSPVRFMKYIMEVPFFISTGKREGVTKARALDARMRARASLADEYSPESMARFGGAGRLCQQLFEYLEHVFKYDDNLKTLFNLSEESSSPSSPPKAPKAMRPEETFKALRAGLPGSPEIAALFVARGGNPADVQDCEARARNLVEAAKTRVLEMQEALEVLSPMDSESRFEKEDLANGAKGNSRISDPPAMLDLTLQMISGEALGNVKVSEAATGALIKQYIAGRFGLRAPPAGEQRLLKDGSPVHDLKPLALQGIRHGDVLTLVRVEVPLLQRLERLSSTIRSLDPSLLDASEARCVEKAANYFAFEATHGGEDAGAKRSFQGRQTELALRAMSDFLKDASAFVQEATKGKQPRQTRITVCERRLQASMAEYAELPLYHVSTVTYKLGRVAASSHQDVAFVFSELIAVLRKLYDDFFPKYWAWGASLLALDEAETALRAAQQASNLCQQDTEDEIRPAAGCQTSGHIWQLEKFVESGIVANGPYLEGLVSNAAREVAELLESQDISHPATRCQHIEKLLRAHLDPVVRIGDLLGQVGKRFGSTRNTVYTRQEAPVYTGQVHLLMVAVYRLLGKPGDQDIELGEAEENLAQPAQIGSAAVGDRLADKLSRWRPLKDSSAEQLQSALPLLLRLWPFFRAGFLHPAPGQDLRVPILFAWAALATSLHQMLEGGQILAVALEAVQAATNGMKRLAEETSTAEAEETTWTQVRAALHCPEDPWLWLRLIGCEDPKGYYMRHGLYPDDANKAELDAMPSAPQGAADDAMIMAGAAGAAGAAGGAMIVAQGAAEEDDDEFEQPEVAQKDSFGFEPPDDEAAGAKGVPLERDPYSGAFDDEGDQQGDLERDPYSAAFDDEDAGSPDGPQPGLSPSGAYSQDDFEMEGNNSPVHDRSVAQRPALDKEYTAEFEGEFEQDEFEQADGEQDNPRHQASNGELERYETGEFEFEPEETPQAAQPRVDTAYTMNFDEDEFEDDDEQDGANDQPAKKQSSSAAQGAAEDDEDDPFDDDYED